MLVFDLDDTLYLERDFALSGYDYLEGWVRDRHGIAGFGAQCRTQFEAGERRHIFNAACANLGIEATPERIAALVEAYRGHAPQIALCPDAAACLDRFSDRALGLISDGPAHMQRAKLAALGLADRFAPLCLTGDWPAGQGKPHPRAYLEIEALTAPGARPVYVADNPAKDFVTPRARGWLTIQITRPGAIHDPTPPDAAHAAERRVDSLDALDALIAPAA